MQFPCSLGCHVQVGECDKLRCLVLMMQLLLWLVLVLLLLLLHVMHLRLWSSPIGSSSFCGRSCCGRCSRNKLFSNLNGASLRGYEPGVLSTQNLLKGLRICLPTQCRLIRRGLQWFVFC